MKFTQEKEKWMEAVIHAGIFKDKDELLQEAIQTLFAVKPTLKLEAAIELFKHDQISLSRAAEIAGLDVWTFRKLLANRGIAILVECESAEGLDEAIEQFFKG